jgi:hypothetical protein
MPGPPPTRPAPAPAAAEQAEYQVEQSGPQLTDPRAGIDDAVAGLDNLDRLPLAEHVERFDAVHTELTVALSSIDKV